MFSTRAGIQSTRQQLAIDFDRLLDSSDILYIVGTEDVQDELQPIFVWLIDALIIRVGERIQNEQRADKPLLLLLDEAANSAAHPVEESGACHPGPKPGAVVSTQ